MMKEHTISGLLKLVALVLLVGSVVVAGFKSTEWATAGQTLQQTIPPPPSGDSGGSSSDDSTDSGTSEEVSEGEVLELPPLDPEVPADELPTIAVKTGGGIATSLTPGVAQTLVIEAIGEEVADDEYTGPGSSSVGARQTAVGIPPDLFGEMAKVIASVVFAIPPQGYTPLSPALHITFQGLDGMPLALEPGKKLAVGFRINDDDLAQAGGNPDSIVVIYMNQLGVWVELQTYVFPFEGVVFSHANTEGTFMLTTRGTAAP